jgi:hypothetical protein
VGRHDGCAAIRALCRVGARRAHAASLAFATFPGFAETLQTLVLFLSLDFTTAYLIEPLVFGQRTGVSSFALLISALFWIWVWGPVGLLLATPLTVCIAVLGRHVRSLRFLAIIFADEPALMSHVRFYQRLLARDEIEAEVLVKRKRSELGVVGVMDDVLIPALALVLQHRSQNEITEEDAQFIFDETADLVQQMAPEETQTAPNTERIVGLAAHMEADHIVLDMLHAALAPISMDRIPHELPNEEAINRVIGLRPALVCVVAISPTRGSEVRAYCRRLRGQISDAKILVLRPPLAEADVTRATERMKESGADIVATSVAEAVEAIANLYGKEPKATGGGASRERLVAVAQ